MFKTGKLLFGAFAVFLSLPAAAQDTLYEAFVSKMSEDVFYSEFSYVSTVSGVKVSGEGIMELQGTCYRLSVNGLEIFCDGRSVWNMDFASQEMVIEPTEDYEGNLSGILSNLKSAFKVVSSKKTGDCVEYSLLPISPNGITGCSLIICGGINAPRVSRLKFESSDGTQVNISFSASSFSKERKQLGYFQAQIPDSSWVVTDLR